MVGPSTSYFCTPTFRCMTYVPRCSKVHNELVFHTRSLVPFTSSYASPKSIDTRKIRFEHRGPEITRWSTVIRKVFSFEDTSLFGPKRVVRESVRPTEVSHHNISVSTYSSDFLSTTYNRLQKFPYTNLRLGLFGRRMFPEKTPNQYRNWNPYTWL